MHLEWSKDYELNIEKIDTHHKRLIEIINRLSEAYTEQRSNDVVENIFSNLINYGNFHFSVEEMVMKKNQYHRFDIHKKEHDLFVRHIKNMNFKYKTGDKLALKTTIDYLNNWLVGHIMVEDRQYSFLLKDKF